MIATRTDGTLWAWGQNGQGSLGQNSLVLYSSPVQIPGTNWTQSMKGLAIGEQQTTMAVKTDGTLWGWGAQQYGELGQNQQTVKYSSPVQVPGTTWSKVSAIATAFIATKTDGTMWSWGRNNNGRLGHGGTGTVSSPVQVPGTTWSTVSGSRGTMAGAIKTDGTLWVWGANNNGELGQNNRTYYSSPKQIPGTTWTGNIVVTSQSTACAKTDGTLWAWGNDENGELGQNSTSPGKKSSPVQIPGTNWNTEFNAVTNTNLWWLFGQRT